MFPEALLFPVEFIFVFLYFFLSIEGNDLSPFLYFIVIKICLLFDLLFILRKLYNPLNFHLYYTFLIKVLNNKNFFVL